MAVLSTVFWTVVLFGILHNIWAIWNVWYSTRRIAEERAITFSNVPSATFVILLPMFEEKRVARATIEHFSKLTYPKGQYHVVVITTKREAAGRSGSTADAVLDAISTLNVGNFSWFEADGHDACKADQLNQTLEWLQNEGPDWWNPDTIVAVYDADSRPEHNSLRDVARVEKEYPLVNLFQQPSLYFVNFFEFPNGLWRPLLKSRPLYNLRFCLYREMPGCFRSVRAQFKASKLYSLLARSPNHFLGHGEYIRREALKRVGGFPSPSGDTSLGTVASFKGEAIYPLSTFDNGESPSQISILAFQGANWYAGCALYFRDLRLALRSGTAISVTHLLMCFKRWLENMIWCVGPILWLISLIYASMTGQLTLFVLSILVFVFHGLSLLLVVVAANRFINDIKIVTLKRWPNLKDLLYAMFAYPLMLLFACSGPILYYLYGIRAWLMGDDVPRWKTNRDT